jgi:tetratricopeptide (TPR) repeat protein
LAEPGGICVSRVVRDQVLDKLNFAFEELGAQQVKNIARPVDSYRVDLGGAGSPGRGHRRWQRLTRVLKGRRLAAGVVALGVAGITMWTLPELWKPRPSPAPPALSVGVMALVAPSGDAAMAQRAETWTRDLTSMLVLSNPPILAVPTPAVQTKAEGGGISGLARTLNVRYLMEGQVRQSQDVTLLSLRLLNGATGEQIGSETASLKASDATREQTRALRTGVIHLRDSLWSAEMRRVMAQPLGAAAPMDYVIRALGLFSTEPDTLERAREQIKLFEEALGQDPNLVPALVGLSNALLYEFWDDVHIDRERAVRRLDEVTSKAVNLDPNHPITWMYRAKVLLYKGQWDASLEASERAIRLDSDSSQPIEVRAWLMSYLGRPTEALALAEQAIAMDPPGDYDELYDACLARVLLGQYELAIAVCERAKGLSAEDVWVDMNLAAAYANHGNMAKAAIAKAEVLRRQPGQTIATLKNADSLNPDYLRIADEHFYSGLRKAGIPEK